MLTDTSPLPPVSYRVPKRVFDIVVSGIALLVFWPLLVLAAVLIYLDDRSTPIYAGERVGQGGTPFNMLKLRTMIPHAARTGVDSTAADDQRITRIGAVVRKLKLDEFLQFVNVLRGDMSLVGPRPQVSRGTALYTDLERQLLSVKPGFTDFATVVFADEGEILRGLDDPDLGYDRLIRPWKSRLALHYVGTQSLWLDLRLVLAMNLNVVSRRRALDWVASMLEETGAPTELARMARRSGSLQPADPPRSARAPGS